MSFSPPQKTIFFIEIKNFFFFLAATLESYVTIYIKTFQGIMNSKFLKKYSRFPRILSKFSLFYPKNVYFV